MVRVRVEQRRQVSTWSSSSSDVPTGWPWAARNVKHMPPPMSSASATLEQGVDHAELVADLGAAEDRDERAAWGRCGMPQQHLDLALARSRPAAVGRCCGGPTIEAWARCDAPKASLT